MRALAQQTDSVDPLALLRLGGERCGEEAHGMIESHRRRTAEKQRMYRGPSINRPPLRGFRLSQTKLSLIPSDLMARVSSLTSYG